MVSKGSWQATPSFISQFSFSGSKSGFIVVKLQRFNGFVGSYRFINAKNGSYSISYSTGVAWQRDYTIIFDIDKNLQEPKIGNCVLRLSSEIHAF